MGVDGPDLYVLAGEEGVLYRPPDGLRFGTSDALFPPDDLRAAIEAIYEDECRRLFFRSHPPFSELLDRLAAIRDTM